jgi:hypothetical protein
VRFIVLFVVPKDQFQTHLRTLAAIAKFLNDRTVRERLGTAAQQPRFSPSSRTTRRVKRDPNLRAARPLHLTRFRGV